LALRPRWCGENKDDDEEDDEEEEKGRWWLLLLLLLPVDTPTTFLAKSRAPRSSSRNVFWRRHLWMLAATKCWVMRHGPWAMGSVHG
jgi:hypothetical protein